MVRSRPGARRRGRPAARRRADRASRRGPLRPALHVGQPPGDRAETERSWSARTASWRGGASPARRLRARSLRMPWAVSSPARSQSSPRRPEHDGSRSRRRDRRVRARRPGARRDARASRSPGGRVRALQRDLPAAARGPHRSRDHAAAPSAGRRTSGRADGPAARVPVVRGRRRRAPHAHYRRARQVGLGAGLPVLPARARAGARRQMCGRRRSGAPGLGGRGPDGRGGRNDPHDPRSRRTSPDS